MEFSARFEDFLVCSANLNTKNHKLQILFQNVNYKAPRIFLKKKKLP